MGDEEPRCRICHVPLLSHGGMKHKFRSEEDRQQGLIPAKASADASSNAGDRSRESLGVALSGDPVLRMALIRKGLITPDDLTAVEAELRASGVAAVKPVAQS